MEHKAQCDPLRARTLDDPPRDGAACFDQVGIVEPKRLDVHEAVIVTILQRVMDIIDPPVAPEPPKPRIGFTP